MPSYLTLKLKSWSNKQEHQTVVIWVSKALSDKTRLGSRAGKSNWCWWDWASKSVCWHISISSDHYNWSQTVNIVTWTSAGHLLLSLSHQKISQQNIALLLGQVHTAEHKVVFFKSFVPLTMAYTGMSLREEFHHNFNMTEFRILQVCNLSLKIFWNPQLETALEEKPFNTLCLPSLSDWVIWILVHI